MWSPFIYLEKYLTHMGNVVSVCVDDFVAVAFLVVLRRFNVSHFMIISLGFFTRKCKYKSEHFVSVFIFIFPFQN